MDQTEIDDIVSDWVKKGVHISQETVDYVLRYCERKMDVNKIENREEYLPLLFKDELKNHLFREYVNATTLLRMQKGECEGCAVFA
ncbi:MAG: hypothetical protein K2P64_13910 [Lachnospiraceae bacterium]|nr:hypothetical protein [Lachnospiraceae bacterium]